MEKQIKIRKSKANFQNNPQKSSKNLNQVTYELNIVSRTRKVETEIDNSKKHRIEIAKQQNSNESKESRHQNAQQIQLEPSRNLRANNYEQNSEIRRRQRQKCTKNHRIDPKATNSTAKTEPAMRAIQQQIQFESHKVTYTLIID